MENVSPIFIDCVGRRYVNCDRRLRNLCPIPDICYDESSARLSRIPHRKFIYLHPEKIWGSGLESEYIEAIEKYAVFVEIKK